jgi:hypothetical protein
VAARFKTFLAILMAVLALGISNPLPACAAAGTPQAESTCCCMGSPACKCHPDKQSCARIPLQAFDKQMPGRMASAPSPHGATLLFSMAPATVKYFLLVSVAHRWGLNASSPFANSPPQAMLCLWLI